MDKVKVVKTHPILLNTMLFTILGIALVALQMTLQSNVSFLSYNFAVNLLLANKPLFVSFLTVVVVYFLRKERLQIFFRVYTLVLTFSVFQNLLLDFNKVILVLLCGLISISYVFDQLLTNVFKMASYHSHFNFNSIWKPTVLCPKIKIQQNSELFNGRCINWDKDGLMMILDNEPNLKLDYRRKSLISYEENGNIVELEGEIVAFSPNYKILGIMILSQSKNNPVSWSELIEIWSERGLDPEWVR